MTVCLPYIDPAYPWYRKLGLCLFNWLLWIVPAVADTFADDIGDEAQSAIAFITIVGVVFTIGILITSAYLGTPALQAIAYGLGVYLFVGGIYHINERWGYYS